MSENSVEFRKYILLLCVVCLGQLFLGLLFILYFIDIWEYVPVPNRVRSNVSLDQDFILSMGLILSSFAFILILQLGKWRSVEERLHEMERLALVGRVTAGIAHEVRNPLTGIRGFLQLLQKVSRDRPMVSSETVQQYTGVALEQIAALERITSEFLLLARSRPRAAEPVDVNQLIRKAALLFESEEGAAPGVEFHLQLQAQLPALPGDPDQLDKVFRNLIKNALESMPEGGLLRVTTRFQKEDGQVVIEIADTGSGIEPQILQHLFEPFVTSKATGTGLGLSICKRIVSDHGGTIEVRSEVQRGTTFLLRFPAWEQPHAQPFGDEPALRRVTHPDPLLRHPKVG